MLEESKETSNPLPIASLTGTGLEEIQYWIWVSTEKFDLEKFRAELEPRAKDRDSLRTVIAPRDPKTGDYHIFINWRVEKDEVTLAIEYSVGAKEHGKDEHEPYSEQFMEWIGDFFKHRTAQGHIHARFEYPLVERQSTFPLPLKTALEGEPEIDGISLKLPSKPEGVSRVRLTQGKTRWYVEVIADKRITFKGFAPYSDTQAFLSVISTLLEEKKS